MAADFVDRSIRVVLCAAATSIGITCGAAFAASLPPHVDLSQPHLQEYPDSAQASGEEGTVLVSVYVRPDGRIAKYKIAQTSGFNDLDNAAIESVLNWRFVPAMHDGDTVSDWATVKMVFQLPRVPAQSPPS